MLLIDIQNDFIDGTLAVARAAEIVPALNDLRLHGGFDLVALSLDWHPPHHCSFARNARLHVEHPHGHAHNMQAAEFTRVRLRSGASQELWPEHCVAGSRGAQLHKDLITMPDDVYVMKGTHWMVDSYSAFFDCDHISQTTLAR